MGFFNYFELNMNNAITKKDREFILEVSEEFFAKEDIVRKLNDFYEFQVKGWEIWLQVEYYLFLTNHSKVKKVDREIRCPLDGRKSKTKRSAVLDFMIHQKQKTSSIPLEIKQDISPTSCLRHMVNDVKKFENIRYSGLDTSRSLWCLGIHLGPINEAKIENCVYDVTTQRIENTEYFFTLI